jgi:hypothetical protein
MALLKPTIHDICYDILKLKKEDMNLCYFDDKSKVLANNGGPGKFSKIFCVCASPNSLKRLMLECTICKY